MKHFILSLYLCNTLLPGSNSKQQQKATVPKKVDENTFQTCLNIAIG